MKTRQILGNIFLFISILFITAVSCAQNPSDTKAVEITDNMKEELNLSDKQYDQVLEINKTHFKKSEDFRNENKPGSGVREESIKIKSEWDSELKKVLTKEQFKKYQENKMNQRTKRVPNNR